MVQATTKVSQVYQVDIGSGFTLSPVVFRLHTQTVCSNQLFTIKGGERSPIGWRAVYLGYNNTKDLSPFQMSRYRKLIPDSHISCRPAKRLIDHHWSNELKVSNGHQPSSFWGDVGKDLLKEIALFLEHRQQWRESVTWKRRHILYWHKVYVPDKKRFDAEIYVNGEFVKSISYDFNPMGIEFLNELQSKKYIEYSSELMIKAINSFRLPDQL